MPKPFLTCGPHCRWPLAIAMAVWIILPGLLGTLVGDDLREYRGESETWLYHLLFLAVTLGLYIWHRLNLAIYGFYPGHIDTLAHMGGTFLVLGLIGAVFIFIGWATTAPFTEKWLDTSFFLVVALHIPIFYYAGRTVADFLSGEWSDNQIPELYPMSPHHFSNRHHDARAIYTVTRNHWISFLLSAIPFVVGGWSTMLIIYPPH